MNRNRNFHKVFCTFALMLILFVFLVSCSTTNGLFGHLVFWDNHTYDNELNNKELTHFFSSVRPPLGNPDSHYLLATYYQERNNHKEAVKEFKKIIVIDPGYVKAYNGLGVSLDTLGFTQKAVTYYNMALDLNPELDYVLNNLGYAYIRLGRYDDAIDFLKKAVEANTINKRFHNNLGLAYAKKGEFDMGLIEFELAGDSARAQYNIGQVYFEKGLYEEAKGAFQESLQINPDLLVAKIWLELADSMAEASASSVSTAKLNERERLVQYASVHAEKADQLSDLQQTNTDFLDDFTNDSADAEGNQITDKNSTHGETNPSSPQEQHNSDFVSTLDKVIQKHTYEGIGIEISNGNGVNRMARRVGNYLDKKGFDVVRLTNADNFSHTDTIIYYQGKYYQMASDIAEHIPGTQNIREVSTFDRSNINIKILIGKDIVKYDSNVFSGS